MENKHPALEETLLEGVVLPESLPDPIKEVVNNWKVIDKGDGPTPNYNKECKKYIQEILPAFTDPSAQKVWEKLVRLNPQKIESSIPFFTVEEHAQKIAQVLLHMPNHIDFVFDQFDYCKFHIKNNKKILNTIQNLKKLKVNYLLSTYPSLIDNDSLLKSLIVEEEKVICIIQSFEEQGGEIRKFQTEFLPVTRQSKSTGKAKLYACFLHTAFKQLYGKPRHADVAALVNAIHKGTPYTTDDIRAMVQSLKKFDNSDQGSPFFLALFDGFLRSGIGKNGLNLWLTNKMR